MSAQHTNKLTAVALGSRDAHRYVPAGSSGRGALVVLAATVAMAMGFGGLGLITVFMGPIEADLRWSRSDTSLGYALSTAGMAIGGLFWGRLSDRMDVRILLAIGATGMVASLLAMSILQSLSAFYIAHVVYGGFGFSVLYAPLLSTSGEWFPERRGLVMGSDRRRSNRARLAAVPRQLSHQCIWLAMGLCRHWLLASCSTCSRLADAEVAQRNESTRGHFRWCFRDVPD
jgi:hypothetical protein